MRTTLRKDELLSFYAKLSLFISILITLTIPAQISTADFTLERWKYSRELTLPQELTSSSFIVLPIPGQLFEKAGQGLNDLRIIRDNLHEEPYKLEISEETTHRNTYTNRIHSVAEPAGSSWIIFDMGSDGILHNEVNIDFSPQVFPSQPFGTIFFNLATSVDQLQWEQVEEGIITEWQSKNREVPESTLIRYPVSTSRYLRILLLPIGIYEGLERENIHEIISASFFNQKHFRKPPPFPNLIVGANIGHTEIYPLNEIEYPVEATVEFEETDNRSTKIVLDLGGDNKPSQRISIDTSQQHFFRDVMLEESNNLDLWKTIISDGTLFSIEIGPYQQSKLSLNFPESHSRYFRLTILDGDNLPLERMNQIKVWGAERKLFFYADPKSKYRLYYGNNSSQAPTYDIERFFSSTGGIPILEAFLEDEQHNNEFETPRKSLTEQYPWLLGMLVGIASIILGIISLKALRKSSENTE